MGPVMKLRWEALHKNHTWVGADPGAAIQGSSLSVARLADYFGPGARERRSCALMWSPSLMSLLQGQGNWAKHLACWTSVHPGASVVCPGTRFPQLMKELACSKQCVLMVYCEQSSTQITL